MAAISLNSDGVRHLISVDASLGALILSIGELNYTVHDNPLKHVSDSILGQMLSNSVANVIRNRFYDLCEGDVSFAKVRTLSVDDIVSVGTSKRKAEAILSIAMLSSEAELNNLNSLSDTDAYKKLISFKGIGPWTAKMFLLFYLQRSDVLPYEDVAFLQSYKWLYGIEKVSPDFVINSCKKWAPYSSIAARYLYRALDSGLVKNTTPDELEFWPKPKCGYLKNELK